MPGVAKHIYNADIKDIQKEWTRQLKEISNILPLLYDDNTVLNILKQYYPHEWDSVVHKKNYYDIKDNHLQKQKGRKRYNMLDPQKLIWSNIFYKKIFSKEFKNNHAKNYDNNLRLQKEKKLKEKRNPKIKKINQKIQNAKYQTQSVTPCFLNKIIGLYLRKNTSQKDKVYLIMELKKYYNDKIINFFFKINDTELNKQLREIAFKHLQSFNYQPRLRKQKYMQIHTKNKKKKEFLKKEYPNQTYKVPETPNELENRIFLGKEQEIKEYDLFVSHSSYDQDIVRKFIDYKNNKGIFVFCDWINDSDYLKRELLCKATIKVINFRLEKSKKLVFVRTPYSLKSLWCKYEINYFYSLKKPIYIIDGDSIKNNIFEIYEYNPKELLCDNYNRLLLV